LVLLAEERDLRQVPAAALHIDAVRLMTVHGSKGLEFEGVHIPGLTAMSFPVSNRGQRCPPPKGMIEGAEALTVKDEAKLSQEHEEQCLFFVACSRARAHLRLYLSKRQPNGNKRAASIFLDWIPATLVTEVVLPRTLKLVGPGKKSSKISVSSPLFGAVTDSQFGLYQKCPRRFFYTHVLGLGNAKKPTAFTRTHDCLQKLMIWLAEARRAASPTAAEAEAEFEKIWAERGPVKHGFAPEYRRLASRLIAALINAGAGRHFRNAEPLSIDFPNGRVLVKPNELAELPNGTIMLRRVATGKKRKDEHDRLEYTLYQLAGEAHFPDGFMVEALHLTDESIETVIITSQKLKNRRATSDEMLRGIAAGLFPLEIDPVTCPRCPHFFVCGAVPPGPLTVPAK
jgi:hypothetical protein